MLCYTCIKVFMESEQERVVDIVPVRTNHTSLLSFPEAFWGQTDAHKHTQTHAVSDHLRLGLCLRVYACWTQETDRLVQKKEELHFFVRNIKLDMLKQE